MPSRKATKKTVNRNTTTRKNKKGVASFEQEITLRFLEILHTIKLFHWKTYSYPTHKATDELYGKLNGNIDSFIEVLLGKMNNRIDLTHHKTIALLDLSSNDQLKKYIENFKSYLLGLDNNKVMKSMSNSDLFNIRDEILADLNQFLYLLTFS